MRRSRSKSGCGIFDQRNHGFVRPIIKRPYFGQSRAKLNCEMYIVASGPDPDRIPDSSAPQPPGVGTDRARVSAYGSIPNMLKAGLSPAFFLNAFLPRIGSARDRRPTSSPIVCRRFSDFSRLPRNRREGSAEDDAGLFVRALLYQDGGTIDVVAQDIRDRNIPDRVGARIV